MNDALRALLSDLIDYAGLFPPASDDMSTVVAQYSRYRRGEHAPFLGRLVIPMSRLDEFRQAADEHAGSDVWPLSLLLDVSPHEVEEALRRPKGQALGLTVASVEAKAGSPVDVERIVRSLDLPVPIFFELPLKDGLDDDLLQAVSRSGASAKIRTGGIVPGLIPSPSATACAIDALGRAKTSFKCTAGLHHPLRGAFPLTYAEDSPRDTMHGFLNVFLAATWKWTHPADVGGLTSLLEERDPAAFRFDDSAIEWRDVRFDREQIQTTRRDFALSFGSCSFMEPIEDLKKLRLL